MSDNRNSLLSKWKSKNKNNPVYNRIPKLVEGTIIPLSHGQKRLWLLQQLQPLNPFYNYAEQYDFTGDLDVDNLTKSLQLIYEAHDVLRTNFTTVAGVPQAVVNTDVKITVTFKDISNHPKVADTNFTKSLFFDEAKQPFTIEKGPVVRCTLFKRGNETHSLVLVFHHMVTDKWSMGVFRDQLATYYTTLTKGETLVVQKPEVQYQDYAAWQIKEPINTTQLAYWKSKLSGEIPVLALPQDTIPTTANTYEGAFNKQQLPKDLSTEILDLALTLKTTPYVLLLTVYYLLLYRYSNQNDILIGTPISNRDQKKLEDVIGFFNNTVVLRTTITGGQSFREAVANVRTTTIAAFENKEVSFDAVVNAIKPSRVANENPFFSVMFLYHKTPNAVSFGPDLRCTQKTIDTKAAKFKLTLYVAEDKGQLTTIFEYATSIFKEATIARFQKQFLLLLRAIVSNPSILIADIPLQTSFKSKGVPLTVSVNTNNTLVALLNSSIAANATAIAITCRGKSITYKQLDEQANNIAYQILEKTGGEAKVIGLCIDRSVDMIVTLWGILKAGCAYLPLDPAYPKERLKFMVQDAQALLVLTNAETMPLIGDYFNTIVTIVTSSVKQKLPEIKASSLAYIIYTSGSSGKPKGVAITHQNIVNSTEGRNQFYETSPKSFLLLSSIAFDSAKAGIFWTLATGGNLVISEPRLAQDMNQLANTIAAHKVTHTLMLPSLYHLILKHCKKELLSSLTTVIVAGEACLPDVCKAHFKLLPNTNLYNEYGPTEATVWCVAHKINWQESLSKIPIGKAVAGAVVYVLNSSLKEVPFGAIGELYIGGLGVSKGYINQPELTAQAFIQNPFNTTQKLYKTGDLVRYNNTGDLEFLGRADNQIKIRGYRVELSEIEQAILEHHDVTETAVIFESLDDLDAKQLSAFVVTPNTMLQSCTIKMHLNKIVPDYMVPKKVYSVSGIPKLPNGKIDKNQLFNEAALLVEKQENLILPQTEIEQKLAEIWQAVLGIPVIYRNDNFFEIGGDSILSIQIVARARKMGLLLKPNQLFEQQTIGDLAMLTNQVQEITRSSLAKVVGQVALTPIQHWFFDVHKTAPAFWNQIIEVTGVATVATNTIAQLLEQIVDYHDALRLRFKCVDGSWFAEVAENFGPSLSIEIDASHLNTAIEQDIFIKRQLTTHQMTCDLEKDNLFRAIIFNCGAIQLRKVFLIAHHLVIDAASWNSIFEDFRAGIQQLMQKKEVKFSPKTTTIAQWASVLKNYASSSQLEAEMAFWMKHIAGKNTIPSDKKGPEIVLENTVKLHEIRFGIKETNHLINDVHTSFNTTVEDVLLAALVQTICEWSESTALFLGLERHGRNTQWLNTDVTSTIGWFTSFFPFMVNNNFTGLDNLIKGVKEQLRAVPNSGIGYGVLNYLTSHKEEFVSRQNPKVIFNYLGNNSPTESPINFNFIWDGARHPLSERNYWLEINSLIKDKQLCMYWSYSTDVFNTETIQTLAASFEVNLVGLINFCLQRNTENFTPSDFPDVDMSQDELDGLMDLFN